MKISLILLFSITVFVCCDKQLFEVIDKEFEFNDNIDKDNKKENKDLFDSIDFLQTKENKETIFQKKNFYKNSFISNNSTDKINISINENSKDFQITELESKIQLIIKKNQKLLQKLENTGKSETVNCKKNKNNDYSTLSKIISKYNLLLEELEKSELEVNDLHTKYLDFIDNKNTHTYTNVDVKKELNVRGKANFESIHAKKLDIGGEYFTNDKILIRNNDLVVKIEDQNISLNEIIKVNKDIKKLIGKCGKKFEKCFISEGDIISGNEKKIMNKLVMIKNDIDNIK